MDIGVLSVRFKELKQSPDKKISLEFILSPEENLNNAKTIVDDISLRNDLEVLLRTKEYNRTIPQNAYVYYLIDQLAAVVGTSKSEIKAEMLKEYGRDRFKRIRPSDIRNYINKNHIYNTEVLKEITIKTGRYLYIKYNHGISLSKASELDRLITGLIFECNELNINTDLRMVET